MKAKILIFQVICDTFLNKSCTYDVLLKKHPNYTEINGGAIHISATLT